ncbi:hypothetical protein ABN034_26200 [Actinopolymorpha sp. B11F2]|uniref:hypothetical protein n=1 Tax=Actinopolymorpha sp. B11F2 TaxID=3160862 RepID=UPI0032E3BE22
MTEEVPIMGKVIVGATVSVDGFIADENDNVGPLFEWYGNGDVATTMGDPDRLFHVSAASAEYIRSTSGNVRAAVIGRHLFDITNGWHGVPAAPPQQLLENPRTIEGDRVLHLIYAIRTS